MLIEDLHFDTQLTRRRKEDEDFLEWLSPGPARSYWLVEAQLGAIRNRRAQNTLQWLVNVTEFQAWSSFNNQNRILWFRGGPGVGKSTMAGYLVDILRCLYPESIIGYFFCKSGVPGLTRPRDIVQTLAYHCMEDAGARWSLEALKRSGFRTEDNVGIRLLFEKLLKEPLQGSKKEFCIVLDGLDEADDTSEDEFEHRPQLQILLECLSTLRPCRLIVLSRPHTSLHKIVPTAITKTITSEDNKEDIRTYVQNELVHLEQLQRKFEFLSIDPVEYFTEKANGIFLWVFLVIQQFKMSSDQTQNAFEKDFDGLFAASGHSRLDERFSIALSRNSQDESWVKAILALLVVGIRPITVDELQAAVEMTLRDQRFNFKEFIEVKCGSFLQLVPSVENTLTVQLIHETFTSFLISPLRCQPSIYFIEKAKTHAETAALCLAVMCSDNAETSAFLPYASTFWIDHITQAEISGVQAVKLFLNLSRFFTSNGVTIWVKHSLSKFPNFRGLQVSVEEQSLQKIDRWLRRFSLDDLLNSFMSGLCNVSTMFQISLQEGIQWSVDAIKWRKSVMQEEGVLGKYVGKAAARVWAKDDLPDFNQTATCFSLGMKYYMKEHYDESILRTPLELHMWFDYRVRNSVSCWAFDDNNSFPIKKNLGVAFFTLRNWERCIYYWTWPDVNLLNSSGFKALPYLGEAYMATGEYGKALKIFTAAIEENPADSLSWIGLGQVLRINGDFEGAIRAFKLAGEKNPGDAWFHKALGDVYIANGDYPSAITSFQKAIELSPADSWLWSRLGDAYAKNGEVEAAISIFEAGTDKFPAVKRQWICLRDAYFANEDSRAMKIEETTLQKFPDYPFPWKADLKSSEVLKRTVWLYTREVEPLKTNFSGITPTAVVVCHDSKEAMENRIRTNSSWPMSPRVHELWNNCGTAEYRSRILLPGELNASTDLCYVGETLLSDWQLATLGMAFRNSN